MKLNRSKHQKKVWAGRSQKERSAIVQKILDSRKDSPKWLAYRKRRGELNKERVVTLKTRKKLSLAGMGRRLSRATKDKIRLYRIENGQSKEAEKKRMQKVLAKMSPEQLKAYKKRKRDEQHLRFLRKSNPVAYQKELGRRIAKGKRRSWKDPEVRAKTVASIKRAWADQKRKKKRLGYITPAYLKRQSDTMKKCYVIGPGARKAWYKGNGKRIHMFSGAEVQYAKWLDSQNIEWLYEAFTFAVRLYGQVKHWTPDFYLVKERKFVEVKGQEHPHLVKKYRRVMKHYSATKFAVLQDYRVPRIRAA